MEKAALDVPGPKPGSPRPAYCSWVISSLCAVVLLSCMAVAGVRLTHALSVTIDEPTHVSAGLSGWNGGDYRQSTGNLFFTQKWAAWPLYRGGLKPPDPDLQRQLNWDPVLVGEALIYSAADPIETVAPARQMTLVLCILTGLLVWGWAAWLDGPWAGAWAVLLYATCPVVLASGVLVTTDTGAAFWYLAALACYGWMLRSPGLASAAMTGVCAAMMVLSKFSIVAWVCGAAILLWWHLRTSRGGFKKSDVVNWHAFALAAGWLTIWSFFGWSFRPGGFTYLTTEPSTLVEHVVALLDRLHILPEPYLREMVTFQGMIKPRPAYLLGRFRMGGFWDYFPVAFLAKSTVAMLLSLLAWLIVRRPAVPAGRPSRSLSPLVAGAVGYALVAIATPLNIGARHILPLFLIAAIAGAVALVRGLRQGGIARYVAAAVAILSVAEGISARQKPLAWFNTLAGGPMSGWRIMVDSSLEWGGDLPDLIAWEKNLRETDPSSPVYVSLLGPAGHEHAGLAAVNMAWAFEFGPIKPGYFVFSATRLVGGPPDLYGEPSDSIRRKWNVEGASGWRRPLPHEVAQLAVARLAQSCRALEPTERIGPVYFVYHLDEKALDQALGRENEK
jgi:Dolichyl-phosphate-mannose-protein mannosyltransferase